MAIKVKHEGNITSRIYASAAGGKGRRQAEDARVMASMSRSGGGGGGTSGGARAGGSAPTMQAPTSRAQLGSPGSPMSGWLNFDERSALQRQGEEAAAKRQSEMIESRAEEAREERAANYSLQRSIAEKDILARKEVEDRRFRREDLQKQGYSAEQIFQLEDLTSKQASILADENATQEEKDIALAELNKQRDAIKPAYAKSATPQEEYDASIVIDPVTKKRYRKNARGEFEQIEDAPQTRTPQEIWDSAFVAPDGTRYIVDNRGGLTPIQNPNANSSAKSAEAAADRRNAYILKRVGALRTEAAGNHQEETGVPFDMAAAKKMAEEEYDAVYGAPMSAPNPRAGTSAGADGVVKPMTAEEARQKYLVGKKDEDKQF